MNHGWRKPASTITGRVDWHAGLDGVDIPKDPSLPSGLELPEPGEDAALAAWKSYRAKGLMKNYADDRNRPDLDRTSHMSVYLKWGCIHPRTLLADLGTGDETYRKEIAWREFYADVLPPLARVGPRVLPAAVRQDGLEPPGHRRVHRLVRGPHRVPHRRRRHASAAG